MEASAFEIVARAIACRREEGARPDEAVSSSQLEEYFAHRAIRSIFITIGLS